ncbi:Type V secretory pathway, adhesin AidA [Pseudoxanthomonas sp. GM95]|uniref:autotransporter family protein n=1 Tax=Pseudoxanthomonas sp. GM95 TaxID=1881043 RepID=UPI0008C91197|nr:autotransporter domain-containing protein [Pseudoxanthomonas sp. GM95]SEL85439.1 Type V secretory pathway, adhesin AidA [Pseudoxanthomonas sp. GM95]
MHAPRVSPLSGALASVLCALATGWSPNAQAGCSTTTPTSGQSVTCDAQAPNPDPNGVQAVAGSAGVSVNLLAGAQIQTASGAGVALRDASVLDSAGSITLGAGNAFDAVYLQGSGNRVQQSGLLQTAGATADAVQADGNDNTIQQIAGGRIVTSGASANGVFFNGGSGNVFDNAGSIVVTGAGAHGLRSTGGGSLINDGSISAAAGWGVSFEGAGASSIVNRGSISGGAGGIRTGSSADRLEMQGGAITGAVTQGDGDDAFVMSDGRLPSLDQGAGADRVQISGGSIDGIVSQGAGVDDFVMSGGQVGALLQGDNLDTFRMTGGRIVGAFEDGDYAEMTGGRIGRVNMKLDDNTFDMSGGTIDGNLVTGFGRDTIYLRDGYIGGNISVSGGDDRVAITGGVVRGEVRMSFGNDAFSWDNGGIVYGIVDLADGNDTAALSNLTAANLGALPQLDGGSGTDALTLDNVDFSGVARLTGWETVALNNDSELLMDGTLRLGDAGTGTGALQIDASSTVYAGGMDTAIAPFTAGALVNVVNAGRIDLTNGARVGDAFTITGNYAGNNGTIFLDTVLGDDASASDRLVLDGGSASGTTGLGIVNAGGTGAATLADGILVVQGVNGATSSATAFALDRTVAAGAFEYFLFKGGVSAGTGENWYLRSTLVNTPTPSTPAPAPDPAQPPVSPPAPVEPEPTPPAPPPIATAPPDVPDNPDPLVPPPVPPEPPADPVAAEPPTPSPAIPPVPVTPAPLPVGEVAPPTPGAVAAQGEVIPLYRVEVPVYAATVPLARELAQAALGTFHERQGEQALLQGEGVARAAWLRVFGQRDEVAWRGDAAPAFDGSLSGAQVGLDLYAGVDDAGRRDQVGVFVGHSRMQGDVRGFALGWNHLQAGRAEMDDDHLGLYWTRVGAEGAYLDAVLMGHRFDGHSTSARGIGIDTDGDGLTASLEVGKPVRWRDESHWSLEPQAQLVWQRLDFDRQADPYAQIAFDADAQWIGRIGLRLAGDYPTTRDRWQPYLKLNLWQGSGGTDRVAFDQDVLRTRSDAPMLEFGAGVAARLGAHASVFFVADYSRNLGSTDDQRRRTLQGNAGLRLDW